MATQAVFVHGIRTSASMWRAQRAHLEACGVTCHVLDLPGHGTRMAEEFTLDGARDTIADAVHLAAARGPVVLVAHSMGGLLSIDVAGSADPPPVAAFVGAGCTALPQGAALAAYRMLARGFDRLPDRDMWLTKRMLALTLPDDTRDDFGAGGYALDAQDVALASLSSLKVMSALRGLGMPVWFVNGQYDQLRVNERLFTRLVPHAEVIVVPRTTHLVTAMRPRVFNAVLDLAIATVERAQT